MIFQGLNGFHGLFDYRITTCGSRPRQGVVFLFLTRGTTLFGHDVVGYRFSCSSSSFAFVLSATYLGSSFGSSVSSVPALVLVMSSGAPTFLFYSSIP